MMIKRANLVIAANDERKKIMESIYSKRGDIIVFENYRKLHYSERADMNQLTEKYQYLLNDQTFRIISTAGCDLTRDTLELIDACKTLPFEHKLILVGCVDGNDKQVVEEKLARAEIRNVVLLPKLTQDDLLFLVENSDLGIAQYHKKNSNNLYCSSGKIYEFLYGKIPVATTDNPPLLRMTEELKVGVSDENIGEAIRRVYENYSQYAEQVIKFVQRSDLEEKHKELLEEIKKKWEDFTHETIV